MGTNINTSHTPQYILDIHKEKLIQNQLTSTLEESKIRYNSIYLHYIVNIIMVITIICIIIYFLIYREPSAISSGITIIIILI